MIAKHPAGAGCNGSNGAERSRSGKYLPQLGYSPLLISVLLNLARAVARVRLDRRYQAVSLRQEGQFVTTTFWETCGHCRPRGSRRSFSDRSKARKGEPNPAPIISFSAIPSHARRRCGTTAQAMVPKAGWTYLPLAARFG